MSTHPRPTRLLIVDDDPSTVRFLSHRFVQLGFEVESAPDGLAALVIAGRRIPDVLITDIRMPKVDGPALARALARNGGRMLTIVISAYDDPHIRAFCREVNAAYAKKGPKLWANIAVALAAAFPDVAARATGSEAVRPPANRFSRHRETTD